MSDLVEKIVRILDEKKAEDIVAIQIDELTILSDYFIIATGTSNTHVRSLAEEVEDRLQKEAGVEPAAVEGRATGWVLMDYGEVLVHLFTKDAREYYNLERLWTDGSQLDLRALLSED